MTKRKSIISIFIAVFLAFVLLFTGIMPVVASADDSSSSSSSATIEYSNVLDDLKKDKNFDSSIYPAYTYEEILSLSKTDPTKVPPLMDVISMAESEQKELFLYVYNPTRDDLGMSATQVSMYYGHAKNPKEFTPKLYDLRLLSSSGVFDKYLVKGYEVTADAERYYNVVELSRPFNLEIDESIENGTTNDKAIAIGKQWYFYYYNDVLFCEMGEFSVLEIEPTLTDYIEIGEGLTFGNLFLGIEGKGNLHYIAFNAENYIIEKIYDADLAYKCRGVFKYYAFGGVAVSSEKYFDPSVEDSDEFTLEFSDTIEDDKWFDRRITLSKDDELIYEADGLFGSSYTWKRILDSASFLKDIESQDIILSEDTKKTLMESQWVFSFVETPSEEIFFEDVVREFESYIEISNVDILRLYFMDVTGKFYNLGVVADKTTADNIPGGYGDGTDLDKIGEMLGKIMAIVAIVVLVVLYGTFLAPFVNPIISMIIKAALKGIGIAIKLVFKIITLPLRLLFGLFKR